jgi:hypothetical protein
VARLDRVEVLEQLGALSGCAGSSGVISMKAASGRPAASASIVAR